ncbi:hypothetical protein, partial [Acetobacter cerevisiae]|uniref:hypothetical protein n=1 Tax=Acetobacter cerevisiae TaxID=178900 RepID=UPI001AE068BC
FLTTFVVWIDTGQPESSTTHNLESVGFPERMTGASGRLHRIASRLPSSALRPSSPLAPHRSPHSTP